MPLVNPDDNKTGEAEASTVRVKVPKRIIHFSDGVLEEYSDDEPDETDNKDSEQNLVDPRTLDWGPWFWYKTWAAGNTTLSAIDIVGEWLASFFGITTPRYYFEIEEFKRREAEKLREEEQKKGWTENASSSEQGISVPLQTITDQPGINV